MCHSPLQLVKGCYCHTQPSQVIIQSEFAYVVLQSDLAHECVQEAGSLHSGA